MTIDGNGSYNSQASNGGGYSNQSHSRGHESTVESRPGMMHHSGPQQIQNMKPIPQLERPAQQMPQSMQHMKPLPTVQQPTPEVARPAQQMPQSMQHMKPISQVEWPAQQMPQQTQPMNPLPTVQQQIPQSMQHMKPISQVQEPIPQVQQFVPQMQQPIPQVQQPTPQVQWATQEVQQVQQPLPQGQPLQQAQYHVQQQQPIQQGQPLPQYQQPVQELQTTMAPNNATTMNGHFNGNPTHYNPSYPAYTHATPGYNNYMSTEEAERQKRIRKHEKARTLMVIYQWTPPAEENTGITYLDPVQGDYTLVFLPEPDEDLKGWVQTMSFSVYGQLGMVPCWLVQGVRIIGLPKTTTNAKNGSAAPSFPPSTEPWAPLEGEFTANEIRQGRYYYVNANGTVLAFNGERWVFQRNSSDANNDGHVAPPEVLMWAETKHEWWPMDVRQWSCPSVSTCPLTDILKVELDASRKFPVMGSASLPIHQGRDRILRSINENLLSVVEGNTGTGKSTWVPLHLYEETKTRGEKCRMYVTQPRRFAAQSLATRVADVTNSGGTIVGYRMGGRDSKWDRGVNTAICFTTVGYLVQLVVFNPEKFLNEVTHIVLDEVHERSLDADFLSLLVKMLLSRPPRVGSPRIRLVIMSATLEKSFAKYFAALLTPSLDLVTVTGTGKQEIEKIKLPCVTVYAPSPYEVEEVYWEDLPRFGVKSVEFPLEAINNVRHCPRRLSIELSRMCEQIQVKMLEELIWKLKKPGVAVLVFLPGLSEIEDVHDRIKWCRSTFLLHSELPEAGWGVGDDLQPDEYRVILATNIAESSVTLPLLSIVIDCGIHRTVLFDPDDHMSTLITKWCSSASVIQRKGRTGRVCPGMNIRLFPKRKMKELEDYELCASEGCELTKTGLQAAYLIPTLKRIQGAYAGATAYLKQDKINMNGVAKNVTSLPPPPSGTIAPPPTPDVVAAAPVADTASEVEEEEEPNKYELIFFDPVKGKWLADVPKLNLTEFRHASEFELLPITPTDLLRLLPTPPDAKRIKVSMEELLALNLLTPDDQLTVSGHMCLQLPLDVILGRMIFIGHAVFNCMADAAILAAAMSIGTCDLFKNPYSQDKILHDWHMQLLRDAIFRRSDLGRWNSEPLAVRQVLFQVMQQNSNKGWDFRRAFNSDGLVQKRAWQNFADKLSEILQRLVPRPGDPLADILRDPSTDLLNQVVTENKHFNVTHFSQFLDRKEEDLVKLLGLALAPGHCAVGQSDNLLYNPDEAPPEGCVYWNGDPADLRKLLPTSNYEEVSTNVWRMDKKSASLMFNISMGKPKKETEVELGYNNVKSIRPCSHDYLVMWSLIQPFRWESEGSRRWPRAVLDWKSSAFTLSSKERMWAVSAGADSHYNGGEWEARLRGVTVLPKNVALPLLLAGRPNRDMIVIVDEDQKIQGIRIGKKIVPVHLSDYFLNAIKSYRHFYAEVNKDMESFIGHRRTLRQASEALLCGCSDEGPPVKGKLRFRLLDNGEFVPLEPLPEADPDTGEVMRSWPSTIDGWKSFASSEWTEKELEEMQKGWIDLDDPFMTCRKNFCVGCEEMKPLPAFTKAQWGSKNARCKECGPLLSNEGFTCVDCDVKKDKGDFTRAMQLKKAGLRVCMLCQRKKGEDVIDPDDSFVFPPKNYDHCIMSKHTRGFYVGQPGLQLPVYADRPFPTFASLGEFIPEGGYLYGQWHCDERQNPNPPTFYTPNRVEVTVCFFEHECGFSQDGDLGGWEQRPGHVDFPVVEWTEKNVTRPNASCVEAWCKEFDEGIFSLPIGKLKQTLLPLIFFLKV